MSIENLSQATQALTDAAEAYNGQIDAIDERLGEKEAAVDAKLDILFNAISIPQRVQFDPTVIHTKSSLNLAVDPADNKRTIWAPMNIFSLPANGLLNLNTAINNLAGALYLSRCNGTVPGNSEAPRFSQDYSFTVAEFVVTNSARNNQQINDALAQQNVQPALPALLIFPHALDAGAVRVPIVGTSFAHLFVRFRNVIAHNAITQNIVAADEQPQPIATHGGNGAFALQELAVHRL